MPRHYWLIQFAIALLVSCNVLTSRAIAADLVAKDIVIIKKFAVAATFLEKRPYKDLVSSLQDLSLRKAYISDLINPLVASKKLGETFTLKYYDPKLYFLDDSVEEYLFHGTQATVEILSTKELQGRTAQCNRRGIFFGRRFYVSHEYTENESSNMHKTWHTRIPSVLVLKKDPELTFMVSNRGMGGNVNEYYLQKDNYSLDNLLAIVLNEEKHVHNIKHFFQDISSRNFYSHVDVYAADYMPIDEDENFDALTMALEKHADQLLTDTHFLAIYAKFSPKYFFKHDISKLLQNLPKIEQAELKILLTSSLQCKNMAAFKALSALATPADFIKEENSDSILLEMLDTKDIEGISWLFSALSGLLPQAASILADNHLSAKTAEDKIILRLIAQTFSTFPNVQRQILRMLSLQVRRDQDQNFFASVLKNAVPALTEENGQDKILVHEIARREQFDFLQLFFEIMPEAIVFESRYGDNILHYLANKIDGFHYFEKAFHLKEEMLEKINRDKISVVHRAVEAKNKQVLELIKKHAPGLLPRE